MVSRVYICLSSVGSFCIGIPNRFPRNYRFVASLRGQNMLDIISTGQHNEDCIPSSFVLELSELKVVQLLYLEGLPARTLLNFVNKKLNCEPFHTKRPFSN